jgi:hypothetical protein
VMPRTLSVLNSYFKENAAGIKIATSNSGPIWATIERSAFYRNGIGLDVDGTNGTGGLNVAVTDSVASNNLSGVGFLVQSAAAHSLTSLVLTHTTAAGNLTGVVASGTNATLRLAQSTITGNTSGYVATSGGVIASYGDNYIDDNTSNTGSLGSTVKQ